MSEPTKIVKRIQLTDEKQTYDDNNNNNNNNKIALNFQCGAFDMSYDQGPFKSMMATYEG